MGKFPKNPQQFLSPVEFKTLTKEFQEAHVPRPRVVKQKIPSHIRDSILWMCDRIAAMYKQGPAMRDINEIKEWVNK